MRPRIAVTDFVLKRRHVAANLSDVKVALRFSRIGLGWSNRRPLGVRTGGMTGGWNDTIDDESGWCLRETAEAPRGRRGTRPISIGGQAAATGNR
jgi:hypothetical protein